MIDLRGLHLGNIARSPAESVRPDLWPDRALVPVLGCTGGVLYDLCGRGIASMSGQYAWIPTPSVVVDRAGTGAIFYRFPNRGYPLTVHALIKEPADNPDLSISFSVADGDVPDKQWRVLREVGTGTYSINAFDGAPKIVTSTAPAWATQHRMVSLMLSDQDSQELMVDGVRVTSASISVSIPILNRLALGVSADSTPLGYASVDVAAALLHFRLLTAAQILDLHADPLLPFRRRQPVYYSVPSGGGSIETPAAMMMAL